MIKYRNGISYFIDIAMAHQIVLTAQMNTKNAYVTKVKIKTLPILSYPSSYSFTRNAQFSLIADFFFSW